MGMRVREEGRSEGLTVRRPAVAGRFYPADSIRLAETVDEMLATARPARGRGRVVAVIAPHAGYPYSGPIAGSAFRGLAQDGGKVCRIVLLGPPHFVPVRGLALPAAGAFETPLGLVPVDERAVESVAGLPQVSVQPAAHAPEHSLEVELPFLQRVLPGVKIVPLLVGETAPAEVAEVLERLVTGPETRIVVSSDLSHYRPYGEAVVVDRHTVDRILALTGPLESDRACGAHAINGLLEWARRTGARADLVDLRNSGDTAGDRGRVVGYGAVAFRVAP